jgi:hypothetical protein
MLANRQLLISFPVISDKSMRGKEKFVTDLMNSLDMPYFPHHKTHQDFTRKIWGNNILFADETHIHKYLFNNTAV